MLINVPSHADLIEFRVQSFFTIEEPRAVIGSHLIGLPKETPNDYFKYSDLSSSRVLDIGRVETYRQPFIATAAHRLVSWTLLHPNNQTRGVLQRERRTNQADQHAKTEAVHVAE